MKTLLRITLVIMNAISVAIFIFLTSCEETYHEPYESFKISKGEHGTVLRTQSLQSASLKFDAIFDQTAIYQTKTVENQHDVNKLMGFSDCNSFHHENSARFGWRWLDGNLEVHAYAYVNGERIIEYIGTVDIDASNSYQIVMTNDSYLFYLEGFDPIEIKRGNHCDRGLYYMLFPYFGGNEVAPHDIFIQVKINY